MPKKTIKNESHVQKLSANNIAEKKTQVNEMVETKPVLVNKDHIYQIGEDYYPSVTTILSALSKGKGFDVWLQSHSQEESKEILNSAGLSGSKIHKAIENMLNGERIVPQEFIYVDSDGVEHKGLTPEECSKVSSFMRWWYEYRPKLLSYEKIVYSESRKYAGTVDFIGTIKEGKIDAKSKTPNKELMFIIDWKTGNGIYASYDLQVAAYAMAEIEMTNKKIDKIAILRLGTKHKAGYEFKIIDSILDPYKSFLGVLSAWQYQNPNFAPKIINVPLYFQLPPIERVEVKNINKKVKNYANTGIKRNPSLTTDRVNKIREEKRERVADGARPLLMPR